VHDAAPGGHPLHATRLDHALVAGVVLVPHAAGQQVSHRLEAAVRVAGEAADVVLRLIGFKTIQ